MRIIIITSSNNRSGGTRQALYQAQGLAARGHDVTLCLPEDSSFWQLPSEQQQPFWYRLPAHRKNWRAAVETLFPNAHQPVIVHAFHNKAVKLVAWWGLFWRARGVVCVAHRGVIFRPGNPLPYLSPAMRAFIVNSQACSNALRFHCPPYKRVVLPNAVPDERVTPTQTPAALRATLGLTGDALIFGCVANTAPVKGMERLIRAFASICHKPSMENAILMLLGGPANHWNTLLATLGIANRVYSIGFAENVCDYLQLFDIFVFPSAGMDSAPNTVLEAMRMGLPIVATRVGGVPDIVQANGLLVPPNDIGALASAMITAAENPAQRQQWAETSRELGKQYSLEARCSGLETIYNRLICGLSPRSTKGTMS